MTNHYFVALLSCLTCFSFAIESAVLAAGRTQPTVELRIGRERYEGRIADRGRDWCVLYDRSGKMHTIDLSDVTSFRRVSNQFAPYSFRELRSELTTQFGRDFEVATTRHYVVCAPRGRARTYIDIFEKTWRRFHMYFAVRGFRMPDPEFPLIAIVLKNQRDFMQYARNESARVGSGVLGYYWSRHNRVIMYEDRDRSTAQLDVGNPARERLLADAFRGPTVQKPNPFTVAEDPWGWAFRSGSDDVALRSGIDADLRETMVHEATHQLGYNLGLHNRTGANPKWIVEGLATVFETPGMETHASDRSALKRVNAGWLRVFKRFAATSRPESFLANYIRDDSMFKTDMTNAYAQSWALSFWLIETRSRKYAEFLKKMASTEVAGRLTPQARVSRFKEAFGDNMRMLDVELLRYYQRLK